MKDKIIFKTLMLKGDAGEPTDQQTQAAVDQYMHDHPEAAIDETIINSAVSDWLDDHPEATTTVQDGSLTESKFADSLKLKAIKDYVTPEMFGAVGDGVADDSAAFIEMFGSDENVIFLEKEYYIADTTINCDWDSIKIFGNGNAKIIWDGTVGGKMFSFSDDNDVLILSDFLIDINGTNGIVFYMESTIGTTGKNGNIGLRKPFLRNLVVSGSVDYVFYITGNRHCDRMTCLNCGFQGFYKLYYSDNRESVGNVFDVCSFYSNKANAIYFEIDVLNDKFSIINSSFTIGNNGQTLFKTGEFPSYDILFSNNRIEQVNSNTFNIVDGKGGRIHFSHINFTGLTGSNTACDIALTSDCVTIFNYCVFYDTNITINAGTTTLKFNSVLKFEDCFFHNNPNLTYGSNYGLKTIFIRCRMPSFNNISYLSYNETSSGTENLMFDIRLNHRITYTAFPPNLYVRGITIYTYGYVGSLTFTVNETDYTLNIVSGQNIYFINFRGIISSFSYSNTNALITPILHNVPNTV